MRNLVSRLALILSLTFVSVNSYAKPTLEDLCKEKLVYSIDVRHNSKINGELLIELEMPNNIIYRASIVGKELKAWGCDIRFNAISRGKVVDGRLVPEITIINARYPTVFGYREVNESHHEDGDDLVTLFYNLRLEGLEEGHMTREVNYRGRKVNLEGDITWDGELFRLDIQYTDCEGKETEYDVEVDSEMMPQSIGRPEGILFNFRGWLKKE